MVDMHIHTNLSDGMDTADTIIEKTKKFELFSITDHNNIEAIKNIQKKNFVSGCEFSINGNEFGLKPIELHILGYNFSIQNIKLNELLAEYAFYNNEIWYKMWKNILQTHKLKIDYKLFEKRIARKETINKVTLAELLVENGIEQNIYDAYNKYVKKFIHMPNYFYLQFNKIEEAIKNDCGYLILAHPFIYKLSTNDLESLVNILSKKGIGLEIAPNYEAKTMALIKKKNLHFSLGSDYHGEQLKTCNKLGMEDENYKENPLYMQRLLLK